MVGNYTLIIVILYIKFIYFKFMNNNESFQIYWEIPCFIFFSEAFL